MKRFFAVVGLSLLIFGRLAHAESKVEQLSRTLRDSPHVETVLPLLPELDSLLRDEQGTLESLPLMERAVEVLLPSAPEKGHWYVTAMLLKSAARMRFSQAEPDKASNHLQALRGLYLARGKGLAGQNAEAQKTRWNCEIALEFLRGDQIKSALDELAELADREALIQERFLDIRSAVAGALHRRLDQMSTNERYELLYSWTMPGNENRPLRIMASLASVESPPAVFARALGERLRADAFRIPEVGGVDGLFSTSWLLVRAAGESGQLKRLTAELEKLVKAEVRHADEVLLLARIAGDRDNGGELRRLIDKRLEDQKRPVDVLPWAAIGAACLARKDLLGTGEHLIETLIGRGEPESLGHVRPFLRRARAIAILKQVEGGTLAPLTDPGLKYWVPASEETALRSAAGLVREIWLKHEDHILHLAGPYNDFLCFRYPLRGEFEFEVEAQNGGVEPTFGSLAFGGLAWTVAESKDEIRMRGLDMGPTVMKWSPFVRQEQWPTYQRLKIRATGGGVEFLVNGHPAFTDPSPNSTSPWLALRCAGDFIPAFRNFRLVGHPVIPREVPMSGGEALRGWLTQFYPCRVQPLVPLQGEAAATAVPSGPDGDVAARPEPNYDWFIRDGVIHGAQRGEIFLAGVQSRLTYFRPLANEESVSYEYLYEPGMHEVHPGLGRLAFLIEPGGVRVHWMTTGDAEWTGLAGVNAVIEPLNRRGPRPLPLNSSQWNRVTISLSNDTLRLELNDLEIYSRKMEPENSRRFSLFYDRSRSAVQVRNVILRGDWPLELTEERWNDFYRPGSLRLSTSLSRTPGRHRPGHSPAA